MIFSCMHSWKLHDFIFPVFQPQTFWTFCCTENKASMKVFQWFFRNSNPKFWDKHQLVSSDPNQSCSALQNTFRRPFSPQTVEMNQRVKDKLCKRTGNGRNIGGCRKWVGFKLSKLTSKKNVGSNIPFYLVMHWYFLASMLELQNFSFYKYQSQRCMCSFVFVGGGGPPTPLCKTFNVTYFVHMY